jgi:hypothetical protein
MLDIMLEKFGNEKLPDTKVFSEFARSTISDISETEDPDYAIIKWMEQEEILFRTFERYLITKRLKNEKDKIFDEN